MVRYVLAVLLLLCAATAFAVPAPPHAPIHAIRLTGSINVDGVLNEPVWSEGEPITGFYQQDPDQGAPCSQRTEARVAYDNDAIYIGVWAYDAHPDSIVARLTRRDVSVPSDRVCVYLDPYHDKRSGYYFIINTAGTKFDGTMSNDGIEDASWDGVWDAKLHRDSQGYTAEFRIPYSQLRFRGGESMVWGFNIRRVIVRRTEMSYLAYQPRNESGFVSRWPDLVGLDAVHTSRALEVLPYVTGKGAYQHHDPADPLHDGHDTNSDVGLDLRTNLGSGLTLNATANPDFGQVEVDPAVVNLTDVETYFQEKRPFFVEGSSNFRFGNEGASDYWNFNWPEPTFFYSRRVGRAPQGGWPDNAQYGDVPVGTTIAGAAKITGKIRPGVNFGTLHAITTREIGTFYGAPGHFTSEVEPPTYYGVLRTLKEFPERRYGLGLMGTAVARQFDDPVLEPQLNKTSFMGGMDGWAYLDKNKAWIVSGYGALTQVTGTAARITALQTSAVHYYQRPDNHSVEVDSTATSLSGGVARLWLNKERGRVISNSAIGIVTPGFDQNDIGFESYADVINAHTVLGYKWSEPGKIKRYFDVKFSAFAGMDNDGVRSTRGFWNGGYAQFMNNWQMNWWASVDPTSLSYRTTRGGPRMELPTSNDVGFWLGTDNSKKWYYEIQFDRYSRESAGTIEWSTYPYVEWKPSSNIVISAGPSYDLLQNDAQYVTQYDDPAMTPTYGRAYVFSNLRQETVAMNFRLNWAVTPNISLQTYVQPYITSGNYRDFKSLAEPGTYTFAPVSDGTVEGALGGNPDFNYRSLRGNAVFRWEYMSGSTFYLVWTQAREDVVSDGSFNFHDDMKAIANAPKDNIFLAKVSYYFTL
jgi:hypothetical protein